NRAPLPALRLCRRAAAARPGPHAGRGHRARAVAGAVGTACRVGAPPQPAGLAGGGRPPGWQPPSAVAAADHGMSGPQVIVGMSGGVDSSVAALLLRDSGTPIAGLFM